MEYVAQTDDLTPIPVTGSGDVARLADSFNRMLASLGSSRERQQRLIADAGHELRTPLTSLRTNIELLSLDATSNMLTETDRREIFGDVNAQLAEFTALIKDLVSLARDDQVAAAPEPIDLRDVITAALERARRRAPKGVEFDVELSPLYVMGESDDLERAITNLLDNAVKWSPPDGTVRIYLEGDRLRVADQGPASRTPICRTSSTASTAPTPPATPRAPASGCRSWPRQSNGTAAGSPPDDRPRAGPSSSSSCPERPPARTWTSSPNRSSEQAPRSGLLAVSAGVDGVRGAGHLRTQALRHPARPAAR